MVYFKLLIKSKLLKYFFLNNFVIKKSKLAIITYIPNRKDTIIMKIKFVYFLLEITRNGVNIEMNISIIPKTLK
ncbi:hypothetical protein CLOHAE12215_02189 [Clostridium haemolyticum]|nr:hypothetical protein CLOHAE12215_02189 [Clostridium haemolyticum]